VTTVLPGASSDFERLVVTRVDVAEVDGQLQVLARAHTRGEPRYMRSFFIAVDAAGAIQAVSSCWFQDAYLLDDGTLFALFPGAVLVDRDGTDGCLTEEEVEATLLWTDYEDTVTRSGRKLIVRGQELELTAAGKVEVLGSWELADPNLYAGGALTMWPLSSGKLLAVAGGSLALLQRDFLVDADLPQPEEDGSSCSLDLQCQSGLCQDDYTCAARGLEAGAICTGDTQCESGQCEGNICL
jgi:hypothetical protein